MRLILLVFALAAASAADVQVLPVQGNIYMVAGPGGNVTVQVGSSGVVLVDTQTAAASAEVLAAVRKLSAKPIRYILNTSADPDHMGGNEGMARSLGYAAALPLINTPGASATDVVQIIAHDNVLARLAGAPEAALPSETFVTDDKEIYFNGEPIVMYHQAAAHTDGDSMVFFRHSDVISTGDIFITTGYPVIDLKRGGSIQGVIDGLNHILDLAVPAHHEEGGTYVIPGHGRICDEFDVLEYRDMVTIIRDRVQAMIKKGMTLEQVKAARPSRDYDPQYGSGDVFVEAVYRSLTAK